MKRLAALLSCVIVILCATVSVYAENDRELISYTHKGISFNIPEKWETSTINDTFIAQPEGGASAHISIGVIDEIPMDIDGVSLEAVFLTTAVENLLSSLTGNDEAGKSERYELKNGTTVYAAVDIEADGDNAIFVFARSVEDKIVTVALTEKEDSPNDAYTKIAFNTLASMQSEKSRQ